jgi:hypothetical protein
MANTYTLIQGLELTTTTASIEFTSIPATYTDLIMKVSSRTQDASSREEIRLTINGDTGANYSTARSYSVDNLTFLINQQTSGTPTQQSFGEFTGNGAVANNFGSAEFYIPNYAESIYKVVQCVWTAENYSNSSYMYGLAFSTWANTNAITSIKLEGDTGDSFLAYSSAYLYGIKNA